MKEVKYKRIRILKEIFCNNFFTKDYMKKNNDNC